MPPVPVQYRIAESTVAMELEHLGRMFGLQEMPPGDRRAEIALLALRSGLVSPGDAA